MMSATRLVLVIGITLMMTVPPAVSQAGHVRLPEASAQCGTSTVEVGAWTGRGQPHHVALEHLARYMKSDGGQLLLVLGATPTTLWVLEAQPGSKEVPGHQIYLREIGFDGHRRSHELSAIHHAHERDMPMLDLLSKRLQAWQIISGRGLMPVSFSINRAPEAATDLLSAWTLKIRDYRHRRTYLWRKRYIDLDRRCVSDWYINTYFWSR